MEHTHNLHSLRKMNGREIVDAELPDVPVHSDEVDLTKYTLGGLGKIATSNGYEVIPEYHHVSQTLIRKALQLAGEE